MESGGGGDGGDSDGGALLRMQMHSSEQLHFHVDVSQHSFREQQHCCFQLPSILS